MANAYFSPTSFTKLTLARAEAVNTEFVAVEAGFDALPTEANLKGGIVNYATEAGAADVYVATSTYPLTAYTAGQRRTCIISAVNTGACTINFDALGAKSIKLPDGNNPAAGDLPLNAICDFEYDGTNWQLLSPAIGVATQTAADAVLTAADVVSTAADVVSTNADVVSTNADVVSTNADVVLTNADVVTCTALVASVNLPTIEANKYLQANAGATAYVAKTATEVWDDIKVTGTDTVAGIAELATDAETATGTATDRVLTPANLASLTASATAKGIVELATDAETATGTDTGRALTPANLASLVASATAKGIVELATDAETATGTDTERALTPANLASLTASATAAGIVELATTAETATGTDTGRAVTPDGLHDMTTLSGAAWMLDEDDFSSDSATKVASQQSIKQYIADNTGAFTLGTELATTSGSSVTFSSIPSGVKVIHLSFDGYSTDGTGVTEIQIGDSGGLEATGYQSICVQIDATTMSQTRDTTAFNIIKTGQAAGLYNGSFTLVNEDATNNTWSCRGMIHRNDNHFFWNSGSKSLSAELDRIAVVSADTLDAGAVNIAYSS